MPRLEVISVILMNSTQILAAVIRGLEENITPELQTNYAKVQVASAIKAIEEVIGRLERGDPCRAENERLAKMMEGLVQGLRQGSSEVAESLDLALSAVASEGDPREKNSKLKEALWDAVSRCDRDDALKILKPYLDNLLITIGEDATWVCPEAVYSLS